MLPRLRTTPASAGFLDGVNATALALMAVVLVRLGLDAIRDVPDVLIAAVSTLALLRFRIISAWQVLVGGLLGVGLHVASR